MSDAARDMAVAAAVGRYGVQIGAYDSVETAQAALDAISKARGEHLSGKTGIVQEAHVGGHLWRRALFTGFADQAEAAAACQAIADMAKGCFVRRPSPEAPVPLTIAASD